MKTKIRQISIAYTFDFTLSGPYIHGFSAENLFLDNRSGTFEINEIPMLYLLPVFGAVWAIFVIVQV